MNIFKQASGKLTSLARTRTFLKGEIFVQTATQTGDSTGAINGLYFKDVVTGAPINQFFNGDIYGGTSSTNSGKTAADAIEIYQFGHGDAFTFGPRLLFKWDTLSQKEVEAHPNTLYLFAGTGSGPVVTTHSNEGDNCMSAQAPNLLEGEFHRNSAVTDDETEKAKAQFENDQIGDSGVYSENNNLTDILNSGDLVFYSPIYGEFFFWHMSRAQDALTRITTNRLLSASMYNMVAKNNQSKGLEDSTSLLDLINGPFRQYQYLDKDFGWPSLKYTTITTTEAGETKPNLMIPVAGGVDGEAKELNTAKDGQIFFVPFVDKTNNRRWQYDDEFTIIDAGGVNYTVHPGDLVVALPGEGKAYDSVEVDGIRGETLATPRKKNGCKFAIIPLFHDTLAALDVKDIDIKRADEYATYRWGEDISIGSETIEGDKTLLEHLNDRTNGANYVQHIKLILENLYKTKVDIDPVTHKIVTSQLPETLLGALKYAGSLSLDTKFSIDSGNAEQFTIDGMLELSTTDAAKKLVWGLLRDADNKIVDKNTDYKEDDVDADKADTDGNDDYSQWDASLAKGRYFIWSGAPMEFRAPAGGAAPSTVEERRSALFSESVLSSNKDEVDAESKKGNQGVLKVGVVEFGGSYYEFKEGVSVENVNALAGGNWQYTEDPVPSESAVWVWVTESSSLSSATAFRRHLTNENEIWEVKPTHVGADSSATTDAAVLTHTINPGDFLIFNGETFDVIDNSDSLVALKYTDQDGFTHLLDGTPVLESSTRNASHEAYAEPKGNGAASRVTTGSTADVVRLVSSSSNKGIQFVAPNAIIFKDTLNNKGGTAFVKDRYINFIDENGIAYASRFHFVDAVLTGDNTVERLGSSSPVSVLQIGDRAALNFNEDLDSTKYAFGNDAVNGAVTGDNKAFKYFFLGDNDGTWQQQISLVNDTKSPSLRLPGYSGTLTTEEYVNDGFQIIEGLLDALYNKTTSGSENFLRTIRWNKVTKHLEVVDSHVAQVWSGKDAADAFMGLNFYMGEEDNPNFNDHSDIDGMSQLVAYADLSSSKTGDTAKYNFEGDTTKMPTWHKNIKIENNQVVLPEEATSATAQAGHPQNVLPNHGGILLNTDSIIDCGFWDETDGLANYPESGVTGVEQLSVETTPNEETADKYKTVTKTQAKQPQIETPSEDAGN